MLTQRLREHLRKIAKPITYQALATQLELSPPNTIQQLTVALEQLIAEDVAADHPLIAALVISKAGSGLPRPGFFEYAKALGLFHGDAHGPDAMSFHTAEFKRAIEFWCRPVSK